MTAQQLFNAIFNASLAVFLITLVAGLGIGLTVSQIVAPLHRVWLLLGTVVLNSLLAPLIAIGIVHLFPIGTQGRIGMEVATIAAAGPAGMKAAQFTRRADMAMALSFTIVLQLLNLVAAPLWAKQIITGAHVDLWTIVKDLLLLVLAPLVVALILRARHPDHAQGWQAGLEKISNIALLIAMVVGIAVNWKLLTSSIGSWLIVASIAIVLAYIALGWLVGLGGGPQASPTISFVSSMRMTPIGLVVIATVLHNQGPYLVPALIFSLVATFVPLGIALEIGRLGAHHPAKAAKPATSGLAHPT